MLHLREWVILLDAGDELWWGWLSNAITVFKSEHEAKGEHLYGLFRPEKGNKSQGSKEKKPRKMNRK